VATSSGASDTGSMTSASTPASARRIAARIGLDRHVRRPDDRDVLARAEHPRLAERHRVRFLRDRPHLEVEHAVLDEHDRVGGRGSRRRGKPFASYGVVGATTRSPGMCMNSAWRPWECWAPWPQLRPMTDRITIGTLTEPPYMYRLFAAMLSSWFIARRRKSIRM